MTVHSCTITPPIEMPPARFELAVPRLADMDLIHQRGRRNRCSARQARAFAFSQFLENPREARNARSRVFPAGLMKRSVATLPHLSPLIPREKPVGAFP
jgi:hypothetical protein